MSTTLRGGFASPNKSASTSEKKGTNLKLIKMSSSLKMPRMLKKKGTIEESFRLKMTNSSFKRNALKMISAKSN